MNGMQASLNVLVDSLTYQAYLNVEGAEKLCYYVEICQRGGSLLLLPDLSPDAGLPVGSVLITQMHFAPFAVGKDLGCGYLYAEVEGDPVLHADRDLLSKLAPTPEQIETGDKILAGLHPWFMPVAGEAVLPDAFVEQLLIRHRGNPLALSSGNHFIELYRIHRSNAEGGFAVVVHNGCNQMGIFAQSVLREVGLHLHGDQTQDTAHERWVLPVQSPFAAIFFALRRRMVAYARYSRTCLLENLVAHLGMRLSGHRFDSIHTDVIKLGNEVRHYSGATQLNQDDRLAFIGSDLGDISYLVELTDAAGKLGAISHGSGKAFYSDTASANRAQPILIGCRNPNTGIHRNIENTLQLLENAGLCFRKARLDPLLAIKRV